MKKFGVVGTALGAMLLLVTPMRRPFRRAQNPPQYLQFIFYRSIPSERSSTGFRRSR